MQPIQMEQFYPNVPYPYASPSTASNEYAQRARTLEHANFVEVLASVPAIEAHDVLQKARAGKIDGKTFGDGKGSCACLLGTIANRQGVDHYAVIDKLSALGLGSAGRAQTYFSPVWEGDRPTTAPRASAIYHDILELMLSNPKAFRTSRKATLAKRYHRSTMVIDRA